MEADRFDRLTRALSVPRSRRAALAAVAPLALGLASDEAPVLSKKKGGKKGKNGSCGKCHATARVCRGKKCRACARDAECGQEYGENFSYCLGGRCRECRSGDIFNGDGWCDHLYEGQFPYCVDNACVACRTDDDCASAEGGPFCTDGACRPCSAAGPWQLLLAGGPDPGDRIAVDDDWELFRNGISVFRDGDFRAGEYSPVLFQAEPADELRVVATDIGWCRHLGALWLHRECDGASKQLFAGTSIPGCEHPQGGTVFVDQTFVVGEF